jgi:WD40 repeat protein
MRSTNNTAFSAWLEDQRVTTVLSNLLGSSGCILAVLLAYLGVGTANAQVTAERFITAVAASHDGSLLAISLEDDRSGGEIVVLQSSTNRVLWTARQPGTASTLAFSPDGNTVAVGYHTTNDTENGLQVFDSRAGKILAAQSDGVDGMSLGMGFASWGGGVEQLFFAPKGAALVGLSNDTLFAWNTATRKFLWNEDVPDRLKETAGHNGPTGHVNALGMSEDGTRFAAARDRVVYILIANAAGPKLLAQRNIPSGIFGAAELAFSPDRRLLALGVSGEHATRPHFTTFIWAPNGGETTIADCGGGIAWLPDSQTIACQNTGGTHVRNIYKPAIDIGTPGPSSDLPILKVGDSLWVAAYLRNDWQDPKKDLSLSLVELGTGKRRTVTLPGRP